MRRLLLLFLFFLQGPTFAQRYAAYDSIADPRKALQQLEALLEKDGPGPDIYYRIAQRKMQAQAYDSSISFCNKALELLSQVRNDHLLIRTLHLKGNAQYYLDDKKKADDNWRQGLLIALQRNDYEPITKIASNLGGLYLDEVYLERNNIRSFAVADSFFSIAYQLQKSKDSLGSDQGLRTMRLMATSLHLQKKYDKADYYYKKVISLSKEVNTATYLGALTFYAELLSETGRHDEALAYAKEAVDFANEKSMPSKDRTHITHVYANVLFNMGRVKEAYAFNDSSYKLLATDYEKLNAQAYAESESKFNNQLLQYQVELERQKKNRLYYLIAGVVLLAAVVGMALQIRHNRRLAIEKALQKQSTIDAFIEGEEREKIRIGRELHDGIAQEIVGVKLAMQQQQGNGKLVEELSRISLDIRNISHELMPQTLKDFGLTVAMEDVCQKILSTSGIRYELHSSLADERLSNKIEITLYRVFQELVHNIIKHSKATEVIVQLRKMNQQLVLLVEDNGTGMATEKKAGIGISNLKTRLQLLDGSLQYESTASEGTTAIVRVPNLKP